MDRREAVRVDVPIRVILGLKVGRMGRSIFSMIVLVLAAWPAVYGQDNYEIQVYGSETVEITQGISSWSEIGFYLFIAPGAVAAGSG
jgi:hypothetical protein